MNDFDNVYTLIDEVSDATDSFVFNKLVKTNGEGLGLDIRAGYTLYVGDECIAVSKYNDRSLQYYGGFEYVDDEYRKEVGGWVFYLNDDNRVAGCLEYYNETQEGV